MESIRELDRSIRFFAPDVPKFRTCPRVSRKYERIVAVGPGYKTDAAEPFSIGFRQIDTDQLPASSIAKRYVAVEINLETGICLRINPHSGECKHGPSEFRKVRQRLTRCQYCPVGIRTP
jgi:hypothetical protein